MNRMALSSFFLHVNNQPFALSATLISSLGSALSSDGTTAVLELKTDWRRWDETRAG